MPRTECPKCSSENLERLSGSYPIAYECKDCKHVFVEGKKSLVDD